LPEAVPYIPVGQAVAVMSHDPPPQPVLLPM
jgi:hypothetical protein